MKIMSQWKKWPQIISIVFLYFGVKYNQDIFLVRINHLENELNEKNMKDMKINNNLNNLHPKTHI